MRDLASNIGVVASLAAAVVADTAKGAEVDLRDFDSAALVINTGAIAGDGLFVMSLQESDTVVDGDFTEVTEVDLVGTLPDELAANSTYKVSYVGTKRYIRAVITKTSGTSIAAGAIVVLGHAHRLPVA